MLDVPDRMDEEDEEMDMKGLDTLWESTHGSQVGRLESQGLLCDKGVALRKEGQMWQCRAQ